MGQGKHRTVNIFVEPDSSIQGKYKFTMDDGFGATNELKFDKSEDGMWKTENYKVTFVLNNQSGANLKFSKDLNKVLWAEPTTVVDPPCPTSQKMDKIFWVEKASDITDLELIVTNKDKKKERFTFGFNFLPATENDGPGANYVLYDPIGNNQNGGWPRSMALIAPLTVGGAGVGALVGAFAAPLLNPQPTTTTYIVGAIIGAIIGYGLGLLLAKPSAEAVRTAPHA